MIGPGIFVGLGISAGTGADLVLALGLAAGVALVNSMAEAQLATPEESFESLLYPSWLQFVADWTLFLAKLTAAATAALGLAGYLLSGLQLSQPFWLVPTALLALWVIAGIGIRRRVGLRLVALTMPIAVIGLLGLILAGLPALHSSGSIDMAVSRLPQNLLPATALLTAAYAGYEGLAPQSTLRLTHQSLRATQLAIGLTWLLYTGVTWVAVKTVGVSLLYSVTQANAAPLIAVMQPLGRLGRIGLISLGGSLGLAGMIGLLLPRLTDRLLLITQPMDGSEIWQMRSASLTLTPRTAWILVTVAISCVLLIGDAEPIWTFSSVAFLLRYALVHGQSWRQRQFRLYSRGWNALGMTVCLVLALWIDWTMWLVCLGLMSLSLIWRGITQWSEE